jgi:hypothetical protein
MLPKFDSAVEIGTWMSLLRSRPTSADPVPPARPHGLQNADDAKDLLVDPEIGAERIAHLEELLRDLVADDADRGAVDDVLRLDVAAAFEPKAGHVEEFRRRAIGLTLDARRPVRHLAADRLERHDRKRVAEPRLQATEVLEEDAVRDDERPRLAGVRGLRRLHGAHDHVGRAEGLDILERGLLVPLADRDDDDHGCNAENDAEARERRPQLVQPKVVEAEPDDLEKERHARVTAGWGRRVAWYARGPRVPIPRPSPGHARAARRSDVGTPGRARAHRHVGV